MESDICHVLLSMSEKAIVALVRVDQTDKRVKQVFAHVRSCQEVS
jgi:hypothetical protein